MTEDYVKMQIAGRPFDKNLIRMAVVLLLCLIAYSNTLFATYQSEDGRFIASSMETDNTTAQEDYSQDEVRSISGDSDYLRKTRPVAFFSFDINRTIAGANATGYHIVNILIHLINTMLVYLTVKAIMQSEGAMNLSAPPDFEITALLVSSVFALHPIQTEAVTYISQRFTSLMTGFFFASIYFFMRSLSEDILKKKSVSYVLSIGFAVLAVMTHERAVILPIIIALADFMLYKAPLSSRLKRLLPFALLIGLPPYGSIFFNLELPDAFDIETNSYSKISRLTYFYTQLRAVATNLRLAVLPINQMIDYGYPAYESFFHPWIMLSFALIAGLAAVGAYLVRRNRPASFGIFFVLIGLLAPEAIFPDNRLFAESRFYLPSFGLFLFAGSMATPFFRKFDEERVMQIVGSLAILLAVLAYSRNQVWENQITLWTDTWDKASMNPRVNQRLGHLYYENNDYTNSMKHYLAALSKNPKLHDVHNGLANIYSYYGKLDDAMAEYKTAIELQPDLAISHANLCGIYIRKNMLGSALAECQTAVKLSPKDPTAVFNLASTYFAMGNLDLAIENYTSVLLLKPGYLQARFYLGETYLRAKRPDDAIREFSYALNIQSDLAEAHLGIASAFHMKNDSRAEIEHLEYAVNISQNHLQARLSLANAYKSAGRLKEAQIQFEAAKKLQSGQPMSYK